jgi:hypothetical protein
MPRGYLREATEGPYIGTPPINASGDLASLVAADKGLFATQEYDAVADLLVQWQAGAGATYLPVHLRVGYKYTIQVGVAVSGPDVTQSHLFLPRWNRRITATGLWLTADSTAPVFQTSALLSCPNNHVNGTGVAEISNATFLEPSFVPTEDYDAISVIVSNATGVVAGTMLNNSACWAMVWERSATP